MPIAIDFGTRNLHLVSGQVSGRKITIDRMFMDTIPTGLIQDGIIREYGGLEMAVRNMLDKNRMREKNCIVTINGNHIYARELDVPKTDPKVLANVVTFEVENAMNGGKAVTVEYVASKQQNADKPNLLHVRATAIQNDYILDYGKMLKNLKLRPLAMDVHPNAIVKLMYERNINDKPGSDTNIMLIDIGCVTSTAYVLANGDLAYTRIIPVGAVDIERYCVNLNNEQAGKKIGLDEIDLSLNLLRMNTMLGDAVRPLVLSLTDGVNRIQQFMSGRIQGNRIDRIFIYGRGSTFTGIEETLSESMNIPVERIRKLSDVHTPADIEIAPYLNAIGALIRLKN